MFYEEPVSSAEHELAFARELINQVVEDAPRERTAIHICRGNWTYDEIVTRAKKAVNLFGADRIFLNPDCGFVTFADNPVSSSHIAEAKLSARAAEILKAG